MSYLVDSNYLVDMLAGVLSAVELVERLATNSAGVSIVSYGEIQEGAFSDLDPAPRLALMRDFLSGFALFSLTKPIMGGCARLRTDLRLNWTLIPDMDLLIAATALHHDLMLVTRNTRHPHTGAEDLPRRLTLGVSPAFAAPLSCRFLIEVRKAGKNQLQP